MDWLRITGEALVMHSRKGEYTLVGVPSGALGQSQFQLDAKVLLLKSASAAFRALSLYEYCHTMRPCWKI